MRRLSLLIAAGPLLLAGCSVGPNMPVAVRRKNGEMAMRST
jgi:hypothetical protein